VAECEYFRDFAFLCWVIVIRTAVPRCCDSGLLIVWLVAI